jgi:hypothetical protein
MSPSNSSSCSISRSSFSDERPEPRTAQNRELHAQFLDQQCFGANFRRQRRREPPLFSGIFRQVGSGARHAFAYHKTRVDAFKNARNL